jgi:hypothetical protein
MRFRRFVGVVRQNVEVGSHCAAFCVYELFLLLPKLSLKGSARRAPRLHGRCILKQETAHRKGRTGAEALARVDSCAWDQNKCFAWDLE